jgi:hypothetical protein
MYYANLITMTMVSDKCNSGARWSLDTSDLSVGDDIISSSSQKLLELRNWALKTFSCVPEPDLSLRNSQNVDKFPLNKW